MRKIKLKIKILFISTTVLLTVVFLFFIPQQPQAAGTTHYIDATNGNDANLGTSPATAWQTIKHVNSQTFQPGDFILFKRGETWREELNVPSSGVSGQPITFGAYGSGEKPIISGADVVSGWAPEGTPNVWQATVNIEPKVVVFNDVLGANESSIGNLDSANEWYWNSNILYVYSTSNPSGIEAGQRERNIDITGKQYITLDGLNLKYAELSGVVVRDASTGAIIKNCVISGAYTYGISFWGSGDDITNGLVSGCTISGNQRGIFIGFDSDPGLTGITIENNDINNLKLQIYLSSSDNNIIRNNLIHDTKYIPGGFESWGNSIQIQSGSDNNEFYSNLIYSNGRSGLWIGTDDGGDNNSIYNNVFYNNGNYGIHIGNGSGNIFKNNIISQDGDLVDEWSAGVRFTNSIGISDNTFDYNLYYFPGASDAGDIIEVGSGSTNWYTLGEWQIATGQDTNSLTADPLFTDPLNFNFTLQPTSPAIDAGIDVGLTEDFEGNFVPTDIEGIANADDGTDIGAYEYRSSCLPPDLNCDGFINSQDFAGLKADWGLTLSAADFNQDDIIGTRDFGIMMSQWTD